METIRLSKIKPNKDNPRIIRDGKFKALVESIKRDPQFLAKRGIVHADGTILGGNQRYMAIHEALRDDGFRSALKLKPGEIPAAWVQDASDWTDEQRRRFVIIDNGAFGEWDFDALANGFDDLPLVDFGVDVPMPPEEKHGDDGILPEKDENIIARISIHPGMWLGKRDEILGIFEKMKQVYNCTVKVEE